jgi:N-acyl-L-homoserine lactone synthetase
MRPLSDPRHIFLNYAQRGCSTRIRRVVVIDLSDFPVVMIRVKDAKCTLRNTGRVGVMATIAIGNRNELEPKLLSEMHEFRHEVFIRRLGWSLPLVEKIERDQYDHEDAVYIMACDTESHITACARLVPTTGAYMLPDVFPELLGGEAAPRDSAVWELSRFATNVRATHEGRVLSLSQPTLDLLDSVFSFARRCQIKQLVLVTSVAIERLMIRTGLDAHRIGPPAQVFGTLCVALILEVGASEEKQHIRASLN